MEVLEKVRLYIARHKMLEPNDRVIVAVSGGPDSVALLHFLHFLQDSLNITLHVAHLNHMFRGEEAKAEAEFVRELAGRLGIPCTVEERDVPLYAREKGLSPQVAAREVRYQFFLDVLNKAGASKVALGHHADDQAESILINIFRGSGLRGLGGISPVRENRYIRPMLSIRRAEIEKYCKDNGLAYKIDSSNLKDYYKRNKIRNQLIPILEKGYAPGIVMTLVRMAEIARSEDTLLEQMAQQVFEDLLVSQGKHDLILDRNKLAIQPESLARRVVRTAFARLIGSKNDLSYEQVEKVINQLSADGKERILELPLGVKVRIDYQHISFTTEKEFVFTQGYEYNLEVPGSLNILELDLHLESRVLSKGELDLTPSKLDPNVAVFDYDKIDLPLIVRSKRDGDIFVPFGLGRKVKLKKFFIDRKVPRSRRNEIPLVVEKSTGRIIWVTGIRTTDGTEICESSTKIILLRLESGNSSNM